MDENRLKTKKIITYTEDMAEAINTGEPGLIKKIIEQSEQKEEEKKLSPKSKKNRLFLSISIVLIFLALAILFFFFFLNERINTVPVEGQSVQIIFTDQSNFSFIDDLSKEKIAQTILTQARASKVKIGGVESIYLTQKEKVIGFKKFAELMKLDSSIGISKLVSDNFLLGIVNDNNSKDLFILLKVRSFSDIFPVLKSWEEKMLYDLHELFEVDFSPETNYLFTKNFEDGIVKNKNARILYNNEGEKVLMYVFADDNSIIIANSDSAVGELILRLNSSKIKK